MLVWVNACIPLAVELSSFFPYPGFPVDVNSHCMVFVMSESGRGNGAIHMCSTKCCTARRAARAGPRVLLLHHVPQHPGPVQEPPACAACGGQATSKGVSGPPGDTFHRQVLPSACEWLSQKGLFCFTLKEINLVPRCFPRLRKQPVVMDKHMGLGVRLGCCC